MELALSLGDTPKPFSFLDKLAKMPSKDTGFCIPLNAGFTAKKSQDRRWHNGGEGDEERRSSSDPPVQLDLLPLKPIPPPHPPSQLPIPWLSHALGGEEARGLDVNRLPEEEGNDATALSSPNSGVSSFQMDFCISNSNGSGSGRNKREREGEVERASDDDENGSTRKKLRLSKEQSAFLEESFKEHTTLNPKQKLALAKQLNLRPRQVEVWFQNRRARTKLKQTEVDCEYLKRCCETLTEENRRLQKELQELRALKTSQSFYMQLPATTLTMCPSCERVASNSSSSAAAATNSGSQLQASLSLNKPRMHPFANGQAHANEAQAHQTPS